MGLFYFNGALQCLGKCYKDLLETSRTYFNELHIDIKMYGPSFSCNRKCFWVYGEIAETILYVGDFEANDKIIDIIGGKFILIKSWLCFNSSNIQLFLLLWLVLQQFNCCYYWVSRFFLVSVYLHHYNFVSTIYILIETVYS